MSDAAFKTAKYPAYTTKQLTDFITDGRGNQAMIDEIDRRKRVADGDISAMTDAERLRHVKESR